MNAITGRCSARRLTARTMRVLASRAPVISSMPLECRPSYRDRTGPSRASPPVQKCCAEMMSVSVARIQKNRCWTTIAERMVETRAELPFIGDQVGLFRAQPGRPGGAGRRCRPHIFQITILSTSSSVMTSVLLDVAPALQSSSSSVRFPNF